MTALPNSRAVPLDRYGVESVAARIARRTQDSLLCFRASLVNKNHHDRRDFMQINFSLCRKTTWRRVAQDRLRVFGGLMMQRWRARVGVTERFSAAWRWRPARLGKSRGRAAAAAKLAGGGGEFWQAQAIPASFARRRLVGRLAPAGVELPR
jgi:hypothetical protein